MKKDRFLFNITINHTLYIQHHKQIYMLTHQTYKLKISIFQCKHYLDISLFVDFHFIYTINSITHKNKVKSNSRGHLKEDFSHHMTKYIFKEENYTNSTNNIYLEKY